MTELARYARTLVINFARNLTISSHAYFCLLYPVRGIKSYHYQHFPLGLLNDVLQASNRCDYLRTDFALLYLHFLIFLVFFHLLYD